MNRRIWAVLILGAWVGTLGWLVSRNIQRSQDLTAAGQRLSPASAFFRIEVGGVQFGVGSLSTDTTLDTFQPRSTWSLDLRVGADSLRLNYRQLARLTRELGLTTTDVSLSIGGGPSMLVRTGVRGDSLRMEEAFPADSPFTRIGQARAGEPPVLDLAAPYRLVATNRLALGRSMALQVLDPLAGTLRLDRMTVVAESTFNVVDSAQVDPASGRWVPATRIRVNGWRLEHAGPGLPVVTWVDRGGNPIEQHHAFGVSWHRTAFEIAQNNFQAVLRRSGYTVTNPTGSQALLGSGLQPDTTVEQILLSIDRVDGPADSAAVRFLEGGRQSTGEGTITIRRDVGVSSPGQAPVGYLVHWLGDTEGDSTVRDAATAAVGAEQDRMERIRILTRWVARLPVDTSFGAPVRPTAVLAAGRAGADGKARLLAAMAHAVGVPARVVTGLAVMQVGPPRTHAWVEMWVDRWLAVDPSFGHVPAAVSLLRLREGGRSRPADLLPLVAALRLRPLTESR